MNRFVQGDFHDDLSHSHLLNIQQLIHFESMLFYFCLYHSMGIGTILFFLLSRSFSFFGAHAHISPMGVQNMRWCLIYFFQVLIRFYYFSYEFFTSYRSSFIWFTNSRSYSTFKW